MMRKQIKAAFAATLAALLCLLAVLPVSANSAESYWEGVSASGVLTTDGECPLVVEHETLTFQIAQLPSPYSNNEEYGASVRAEYTFYNPSDMTITANLLFPFGIDPYYMERYDPEKGEYETPDHTEKYGAQVNGAAVETVVRHSYWGGSLYNFDPVAEMAKLHDGYRTDSFLSYDLPVHVYTYRAEVDHQTYRAARVATYIDQLPSDTRVLLQDATNYYAGEGGGWLGTSASYSEIVFYVFGRDIGEVEWTLFENGGLDKEIEGSVKVIDKQSTTLGALAMQAYDPASGVSEHDWFNAVIAQIEGTERMPGRTYGAVAKDWDVASHLLQWYEYKITLTPGERLTNTVTAPLYPNIDGGYEQHVYSYEYFLSPASLWKEFGTLDIYINTPYVMVNERKGEYSIAPDEWTKTDAGYELHLDGLPHEDLVFTLCEVEDPKRVVTAYTYLGIGMIVAGVLIALVLTLAAVAAVIAVIAAVIALFRKLNKRKKKKEPEETS